MKNESKDIQAIDNYPYIIKQSNRNLNTTQNILTHNLNIKQWVETGKKPIRTFKRHHIFWTSETLRNNQKQLLNKQDNLKDDTSR